MDGNSSRQKFPYFHYFLKFSLLQASILHSVKLHTLPILISPTDRIEAHPRFLILQMQNPAIRGREFPIMASPSNPLAVLAHLHLENRDKFPNLYLLDQN